MYSARPVCLVVVLLAACHGGGGESFGLDHRVEVAALPLPDGLPDPLPVQWTNAFPALVFDQPVLLTAPPDGTDRVVVVEQPGRVRVFANDADVTAVGTFLDLSAQVQFGGEEGLLGFAFHPDYATNGWFYVYYTAPSPRRSVLSRFTVSGDPDVADPASEVILLEFEQPYGNHNAGSLAFGPDGKLYVASGDGGSGNDPHDNAQSLQNLLGKILRLEPDGSVPPDNPFVGMGGGVREEIWAYGLRNPWRTSFDPASGRLWAGDVGQGAREEVDVIERGANYGWRVFEGDRDNLNPTGIPASAFAAPVVSYSHSEGACVIGGYVYRGSAVPDLIGAYVYADFVSGKVWALVYDGIQAVQNTLIATTTSPASFGEDAAGELYACCFDGVIRRLVAAPPATPTVAMPAALSGTGLFADVAQLQPAPGVLEYAVNAPLWSDGAEKRRWLALPGPSRIGFRATGAFDLPVGTALVKHFELPIGAGATVRVETRVLLHQLDGWHGYTYLWNATGSDADLVGDAGADVSFTVDFGGGAEVATWHLPGRSECLACHTAAAGRVLGLQAAQLNRAFAFPARVDNQLRAWNHIGLFATDIGPASGYGAWPDPHGAGASLDERARAWLAANCAPCHRPAGPTPVDLDLRYEVDGAAMHLFGVTATSPVPGGAALRAQVGSHAASDLWLRAGRRDAYGMPPLGSSRVDPRAQQLLAEWLDAGPVR